MTKGIIIAHLTMTYNNAHNNYFKYAACEYSFTVAVSLRKAFQSNVRSSVTLIDNSITLLWHQSAGFLPFFVPCVYDVPFLFCFKEPYVGLQLSQGNLDCITAC